jgi:histidine ammonia-lyase
MTACQAIEFRRPLKSSAILEFAHDYVRQFVGFASEDRIFAKDINDIKAILSNFSFVSKVNAFAQTTGVNLPDTSGKFQIL